MNRTEINALLKDEYLQLEQIIVSLDERAITIKAWSVTASMAGLSVGFLSNSHILLLLASLSSIIFWLIEGYWKQFQSGHYKRCRDIENYFAGEIDALLPLQIAKSFVLESKKFGIKTLWKQMHLLHVALPHIVIAAVGIIIFILASNGTIEI